MKDDLPIVGMTVHQPMKDIGAAAAKALPPGRRYRYEHATTYTLADGRTVPGAIHALTKPKLAERIKDRQNDIDKGAIFAMFRNGEFVGTMLRMSISIGGG